MLRFQNFLRKLIRTLCIWLVIFLVFAGLLGMPHLRVPFGKDTGLGKPYLGFGGIRHVESSAYPNKPPLVMLLPLERPLREHVKEKAAAFWQFSFGPTETGEPTSP